jgi:hypothetical protein
MFDEIGTAQINDLFDDVCFGFPDVRVVDRERRFSHQRKDFLKAAHHPWVRGARSATTDDLRADGQVQGDHAILVEAHTVEAQHLGDGRANRDKQERPPPPTLMRPPQALHSLPSPQPSSTTTESATRTPSN